LILVCKYYNHCFNFFLFYRGNIAFCSIKCRDQQILSDETDEKRHRAEEKRHRERVDAHRSTAADKKSIFEI
jgi:hypothetical protein